MHRKGCFLPPCSMLREITEQYTRRFIMLCFMPFTDAALFTDGRSWQPCAPQVYQRRVANRARPKSISAVFPTVRAPSLPAPCFQPCTLAPCLSHLVILTILPMFSLLFHLVWWSVICDVTVVIILGCHKLHPNKMVNCPTHGQFSHLSASRQTSLFPEAQQYWNQAH